MIIVGARRKCATLMLVGAGLMSSVAAQAGPEVTIYLTLPLGSASSGHVLGLRLDKSAPPADVRVINPDSPLNRRALMDLQLGANAALRLELARRLTWDIDRQELRQSSRPAEFTLRLPVHRDPSVASATNTAGSEPGRKPLVKSLAIEP